MKPDAPQELKERTKHFALRIIRLYSALPRTTVAQVLGKQLLRAGTSVGAHYREARRAKSNADFISKMEGGLQELDETDYWLDPIKCAELITPNRLQSIQSETDELMAIFYTIIKHSKDKPDL